MAILYGARGGPATTSDLYTIDPATGTPTSVGPIGFAVTGLAFDPTDGTLYGVTSNNSAANPRSLITVDPVTGAGTLVGALGLGAVNCSDIAFTADGTLYGWTAGSDNRLVSINKATGAATVIGASGDADAAGGLTATDVVLYHVTIASANINTVDTATGAQTLATATALERFIAAAAYRFDVVGLIYTISTSSTPDNVLQTANPATGDVVVIGSVFATGAPLDALAWDDPGITPPPPPPPPFVGPHVVIAKLYDLGTTELADISEIALEKSLTRIHNGPRSFTIQAPAGHSLLTTIADDGYPNLRKGNRKLVVWEDADPDTDDPIFHGRIHQVERNGDGTQNLVTITAHDQWAELGYDADDRAGRPVRGSTNQPTAGDPYGDYDGNFISPKFASSVEGQAQISGPDLIRQILTNSQNTGGESDPTPGEGPLPIDLRSGSFSLVVPPAIDVSPVDTADWPVLIGDFINQLVETNVVDVDMIPVRPGTGLDLDGDPDPYIMVKLNAVNRQGVDRSGTVHFDYFTGSRNASACRHVEDFSTICNKLYDYLGPRIDQAHWRGVITPTYPGAVVDPDDSRDLYNSQFMQIRVFDSLGTEASSRPLYVALWNAEMGLRIEPRDLLFITPNPDTKALWEPPANYDVGDEIGINTGADFGIALAEKQRVYGYTKAWSREGVARVGQLATSADVT